MHLYSNCIVVFFVWVVVELEYMFYLFKLLWRLCLERQIELVEKDASKWCTFGGFNVF